MRTPLTALIALAESLRNLPPVEQTRTANAIVAQAHVLHALVGNLLDMARLPPALRGRAHQLFDRFTRGQTALAPPGVGLELAICKATVQARGGEIAASDAPGGGAEFHITLPRRDPPIADPGYADRTQGACRKPSPLSSSPRMNRSSAASCAARWRRIRRSHAIC